MVAASTTVPCTRACDGNLPDIAAPLRSACGPAITPEEIASFGGRPHVYPRRRSRANRIRQVRWTSLPLLSQQWDLIRNRGDSFRRSRCGQELRRRGKRDSPASSAMRRNADGARHRRHRRSRRRRSGQQHTECLSWQRCRMQQRPQQQQACDAAVADGRDAGKPAAMCSELPAGLHQRIFEHGAPRVCDVHSAADTPIDADAASLFPLISPALPRCARVNFASSGSMSGAKRATGVPARSTKNFSKFHSTSGSGFGVTPNSIRC